MLAVAAVLMLAVGNAELSLKLMSCSTPASQQPAPAMAVVTPVLGDKMSETILF